MNYGEIILRLECLIHEWIRKQIAPIIGFFFKGRV